MKFKTMPLAFKYCTGSGIEIGAASHNPFDLPDCRFVAPCDGDEYLYPADLRDYEHYKNNQIRLADEMYRVDLIGDFQSIPAADASFDYVLSSHVIEHVPNVIGALIESDRVLKDGGTFFCIFPKRDADAGDRPRALSTLQSAIENHEKGISMDDMPIDTWRLHYQVFSLQSMLVIINHVNAAGLGTWLIECVEETDSKVGNGHTVVLRKFSRLPMLRWADDSSYNDIINQLMAERKFETALNILKAGLSYNFADHEKLYTAAMINMEMGEALEGAELLQQALILAPENAQYRAEFLARVGRPYINPVL